MPPAAVAGESSDTLRLIFDEETNTNRVAVVGQPVQPLTVPTIVYVDGERSVAGNNHRSDVVPVRTAGSHPADDNSISEDSPLIGSAADSATDSAPANSKGLWVVGLCLCLFLCNMTMCLPVIPDVVERDLGKNGGMTVIFMGTNQAISAALQLWLAPSYGLISDSVGRVPLIEIGLAAVVFDAALKTCYPSVYTIAIGSLVTGLGSAGVMAGLASMVVDTCNAQATGDSEADSQRLVKAIGMYMGVPLGFAFVLGPVAGGCLSLVSFRLVFGLALLFGSINLYIVHSGYLTETVPVCRDGESEREELSWERFKTKLDTPWASVKRTLTLFNTNKILWPLGFISLATWISLAAYPIIFIFAKDEYGWTSLTNGILLATLGLSLCLVQGLLAGWANKRYGEKASMIGSLVGQVAMMTALGLSNHSWMIFAIIVAFSPAHILIPATRTLMANQVDASHQGHMNGAAESLTQLGLLIGPLIFMPLYSTMGDPKDHMEYVHGIVFYMAALILLLALTVAVWACNGEYWRSSWPDHSDEQTRAEISNPVEGSVHSPEASNGAFSEVGPIKCASEVRPDLHEGKVTKLDS